jgi:16S rRNA (cytosine967-C5)-methyltransferase
MNERDSRRPSGPPRGPGSAGRSGSGSGRPPFRDGRPTGGSDRSGSDRGAGSGSRFGFPSRTAGNGDRNDRNDRSGSSQRDFRDNQDSRAPRQPITARDLARKALAEVDRGAYANLILPEIFRNFEQQGPIDPREKAFATELTYGTVRMRRACDWIVQNHIERDTDPETLRILHLGAYQLVFLGVPPHAALAETVELAPEWSKGFVNAILRRVATTINPPWPNMETELSYPDWIVDLFVAEFGVEKAERILRAMNEPAEVHVREDGYIQDPASQMVAESVNAQPGDRVLDVCAAPGGKTTFMAGMGAHVTAVDLHMHRSRLVRRNARDMHVADLVEVLVSDSTKLPVQEGSFDRVLLDAPCSGLGSLRRRPDARWRMEEKEIPVLVDLQKRLVDASVRALRVGGTFVYSVCTLTADETVGIDEYIAENYPEFEALSPVRGHAWEPVGRGARIVPAETDGMAVFRYELTTALPPLPVVEARVVAGPAPAKLSDALVDHNAEVDPESSFAVGGDAHVDGDQDDAVVSENEASAESVDGAPIAEETSKGEPQPEVNRLVSDQAPASNAAGPTSSLGQAVLLTDRQAGSGAPGSNAAGPTSSPGQTGPLTDRQAGSGTPAQSAKSAPAAQPRRKAPKPVAPSILDLDEL